MRFLFEMEFLRLLLFLLPLGVVGMWRWFIWFLKRMVGMAYRPTPVTSFKSTVSVIAPVYNENPDYLRMALESWAHNGPDEIIAVIDHTDTRCIAVFTEFAKQNTSARLIISHTPGKRPALAEGFRASTGEIVIFADCDTIWDENILPFMIAPFVDPKVGGVTIAQRVLKPDTVARKIFNMQLTERYNVELPFLAVVGNAFTCFSGRTAIYRRQALEESIDAMTQEMFLGKQCISGDDKCLTRLVQQHGWEARFQQGHFVRTPAAPTVATLIKQQIRWQRNTWRSDLKSVGSGWMWRREPALGFYMIDRFIQPFTLMMGPAYFTVTLVTAQFQALGILVSWWIATRCVKHFRYFSEHVQDVIILPNFIFFEYFFAFLKIYALFTMNTQGWITRWDASRSKSVVGVATRYAKYLPLGGLLLLYIMLCVAVYLYLP
ncbi:MAG: glycosyltransferase [Candidatus Peribacteraceae bacterium]|nr:glycosyltransferase [Candidatus Peribacteraceae bacterium]